MYTKGIYLYFIASLKYIKTRSILCTNRILEYSSFSLYPLPLNFYIMMYLLMGRMIKMGGVRKDRALQLEKCNSEIIVHQEDCV